MGKAFFSSRLLTCPHTIVLQTLIDNVKLNFFYLSVLWNYYAYTYSFFDNISHTFCEKNGHPLLGLSSKVFTFDHLFGHRSDFFNSLAIFFDGPEDNQNRCLSSSSDSVGLHFHEGVEKTKENDKNTKNRKLQNGKEKYGGKTSRTCTVRDKNYFQRLFR